MLNVLLPRRNLGPPRAWHGVAWCVGGLLVLGAPGWAQAQQSAKKGAAAPVGQGDAGKTSKPGPAGADAQAKPAADDAAVAPDVAAAAADPSRTRKISPNEVFRDPRAEALLDITKYRHENYPPVGQSDIDALKGMAGDPNATIDKDLINRVINAMVSKLTDHANIQALIEVPAEEKAGKTKKVSGAASHEIAKATETLLEPLFSAKDIKQHAFLAAYNRALIDRLSPLLKNHLIPRIQAMIVLGELGSPDALKLYKDQLNDRNQTVWVKLWALEGIVNLIEEGARLSGQAQVDAAKVVADFLDKEDDLPWPVQLRAMEALAALRYGYDPARPRTRRNG